MTPQLQRIFNHSIKNYWPVFNQPFSVLFSTKWHINHISSSSLIELSTLKNSLVYFGLPGISLMDNKHWHTAIKLVIITHSGMGRYLPKCSCNYLITLKRWKPDITEANSEQSKGRLHQHHLTFKSRLIPPLISTLRKLRFTNSTLPLIVT